MMFEHEQGSDGYDYHAWMEDVWHKPTQSGFAGWLLIALTAIVCFIVFLVISSLLPPGRYPRLIFTLPILIVAAPFHLLASLFLFTLFVEGKPRAD